MFFCGRFRNFSTFHVWWWIFVFFSTSQFPLYFNILFLHIILLMSKSTFLHSESYVYLYTFNNYIFSDFWTVQEVLLSSGYPNMEWWELLTINCLQSIFSHSISQVSPHGIIRINKEASWQKYLRKKWHVLVAWRLGAENTWPHEEVHSL